MFVPCKLYNYSFLFPLSYYFLLYPPIKLDHITELIFFLFYPEDISFPFFGFHYPFSAIILARAPISLYTKDFRMYKIPFSLLSLHSYLWKLKISILKDLKSVLHHASVFYTYRIIWQPKLRGSKSEATINMPLRIQMSTQLATNQLNRTTLQ